MPNSERILSTVQAAALCGVPRSTLSYWIRTNKLHAERTGKKYSIRAHDMVCFLKSTGRNIPHGLAGEDSEAPIFRTIPNCWDYWKAAHNGRNCKACVVFTNQLEVCFTAKETSHLHCQQACGQCQYYLNAYLPRIQFIHQIDFPATVYKGLHVWAGNRSFAGLCGVERKDLPGMGIERLVHKDSLETVISVIKKRALGDSQVPRTYSVFFKNAEHGKLRVRVSAYPLSEPQGTKLVLFDTDVDESNVPSTIAESNRD